jgi:uncharacterized protein involved in exopolysaccharide biosynthesis
MLRRDFLAGAPAGLTRDLLRVERMGQSALLRLEARADPRRAKAACDFAVTRAADQASSSSQAAQAWLLEEQQRRQGEVEANEEQLRSFDQEHSLISISYEDQLELGRRELRDLEEARERGKPGLSAAIENRKNQLLQLELALVRRERLAKSVESTRALLEATEARLASYVLSEKLSPPLRLLEACAPCVPRE